MRKQMCIRDSVDALPAVLKGEGLDLDVAAHPTGECAGRGKVGADDEQILADIERQIARAGDDAGAQVGALGDGAVAAGGDSGTEETVFLATADRRGLLAVDGVERAVVDLSLIHI